MSDQPTLPGMTSATSSQESPGGPLPSNSPAGPTIGPYGQGVAHARASRRRASGAAATIPGICGPSSADSLQNASLLWSSASKSLPVTPSGRLQARLGAVIIRRLQPYGSMVYKQAWKVRVTPSGFTFLAHTALGRTTSGSGCTGWPSPNAGPQNDTDTQWEARRAICKERHGNNGFGLTLGMASQLSGWPSPKSADAAGSVNTTANRTPGSKPYHAGHTLVDAAILSGWPTAAARDWRDGRSNQHGKNARPLNEVANLAGWSTPQANEPSTADRPSRAATGRTTEYLGRQALGPTSSSSPAGTERRGVLDGAFALWLMGYPETWQHSCPGWKSWDTIQRLLAESSEKPAGIE